MSMNRKPSVLHQLHHEWPYAADKTSLVRSQLDQRDPIDRIEEEEVAKLLEKLTDQGPELRPAIAAALSGHRWRHVAETIGRPN